MTGSTVGHEGRGAYMRGRAGDVCKMYADQITLGVQTGPDRTGRFEKALVDGLAGIRRARHNTQSETGGQEVPSSNLALLTLPWVHQAAFRPGRGGQ